MPTENRPATTNTTRIFIRQFSFQFQFGNPSEVQLTKALICTRKQNPGVGGRCISGSGSGSSSSSSSSSGGKTTS